MPLKKTSKNSEKRQAEIIKIQNLVETIQQMQSQIDTLKQELARAQKISSTNIGIIFLIPGISIVIFSVLLNSSVLAFIGLSLTFWGFLFFLIRPVRYVKSSILDSASTSTYSTIDRIIQDLGYKGKSYYIPPYPKEVYIPEHLKSLKDMIVFISSDSSTGMPSLQEMAEGKFILKNPQGICVTPPGLGLLNQIEDELKIDMTKLKIKELCEILPSLIQENFPLAREIQMKWAVPWDEKQVYLEITDSIFKSLYRQGAKLGSIHLLGSPLVSAIACAIAKTTGKIVKIQNQKISLDGQTIQVWFSFLEGQ